MTRALILSDIHSAETGLRWLLEQVWKQTGPIDAYIFLGDGLRVFDGAEGFIRRRDPRAAICAVRGNCDFLTDRPEQIVLPLGGLKIYATHGHIHRVKSGLYALREAARAAGADIALYGHTHCANVDYTTPWLINPGAVENDCCALLEIDGGKPRVELVNLGFK